MVLHCVCVTERQTETERQSPGIAVLVYGVCVWWVLCLGIFVCLDPVPSVSISRPTLSPNFDTNTTPNPPRFHAAFAKPTTKKENDTPAQRPVYQSFAVPSRPHHPLIRPPYRDGCKHALWRPGVFRPALDRMMAYRAFYREPNPPPPSLALSLAPSSTSSCCLDTFADSPFSFPQGKVALVTGGTSPNNDQHRTPR